MIVYVIIVTYNGSRWVNRCFDSLLQSSIPLKIIAIDNASSDNTLNLLTQYSAVEVIETNSNLGFGKANNLGFKIAVANNADYVFLLNQDAWVENDTIEKLVLVAEQNKSFGIISPFHLLPISKALEWHFSVFISADKCKDLVSDIYLQNTKEVYQLDFVNAAAWLISRDCLRIVGGFDPLFPHYGEDDDYCNRVLYKNFKIGVTPIATITHDVTMKSWDEIKFNPTRQLIFCFIELKNIRLSYNYLLFNYIKVQLGKLFSLIVFRRWKEFFFMAKVFFNSISYLLIIRRSRAISKKEFSYLE